MMMHPDNIEWADEMEAWKQDPENKSKSKAGDDRTPAWRWLGNVYHDGEHIAVPSEAFMKCLMKAGAAVLTGEGKKTFKAQTQSGIIPLEAFFKLETSGGYVLFSDLWKMQDEENFAVHKKWVEDFGMSLDVRRIPVGMAKHIRVRPRFNSWAFTAQVVVTDEMLTTDILKSILRIAGDRVGLLEWRPSAPRSPGPFGRFSVEVQEV